MSSFIYSLEPIYNEAVVVNSDEEKVFDPIDEHFKWCFYSDDHEKGSILVDLIKVVTMRGHLDKPKLD